MAFVLLWNCSTKFRWKTIHSRGFATFQLINAIIIEVIFLQQILVSQRMPSSFLYSISEFLCSRSCSHHWLARLYIFKKVNWSILLWSVMFFCWIWNEDTRSTLKRLPFLMCFIKCMGHIFLSLKDKNPFCTFTQLQIWSGPLDNIQWSLLPLPIAFQFFFLFQTLSVCIWNLIKLFQDVLLCQILLKQLFCDLLYRDFYKK